MRSTQIEAADPNFRSAHAYLGIVYWEGRNYEAALQEYRKEASLRGKDEAVKDFEAQQAALQAGGVQGMFQYRLSRALRAFEHENGSAFAVASAYGYLRQRDEAMKYLELARQSRDIGLTNLELAHGFAFLHSDPQFRQLVVDVGLPALR